LLAHSPVRPRSPQVGCRVAMPPLRVLLKIASTCCSVSDFDRVVLVDVDREHVDAGRDLGRLVAELLLELVDLLLLHRAAHRAEVRRALDQRGRSRRRALALRSRPSRSGSASGTPRPRASSRCSSCRSRRTLEVARDAGRRRRNRAGRRRPLRKGSVKGPARRVEGTQHSLNLALTLPCF
jgi:hypothetical protein